MIQWASPSTKIEKEISSFIEISYELFPIAMGFFLSHDKWTLQ